MGRFWPDAASAVVVLAVLCVASAPGSAQSTAGAPPAAPTPPGGDPSRPHKSVYGKLESIDKSQNSASSPIYVNLTGAAKDASVPTGLGRAILVSCFE
jgi:hypothetical protein